MEESAKIYALLEAKAVEEAYADGVNPTVVFCDGGLSVSVTLKNGAIYNVMRDNTGDLIARYTRGNGWVRLEGQAKDLLIETARKFWEENKE